MFSVQARQFLGNGATFIQNCLGESELAGCREAFEWAVANPGPNVFQIFAGTEHQTHNDNSNPNAKEKLENLVAKLPFGEIFAELWGSKHVWYFAEEIFLKRGGRTGRSPWHQDTSYLPWAGDHWGNAWISFDPLPKANALEVVRGSHKGPLYDGSSFTNPDDPTEPLHGPGAVPALPRLPDIEAERAADPDAYVILSWDTLPGDVLLLHPGCLHGGAPVDAACPSRRTIVFRFFGDDAVFRPTPSNSAWGLDRNGFLFIDEMAKMEPGQPFRSPLFRQIH